MNKKITLALICIGITGATQAATTAYEKISGESNLSELTSSNSVIYAVDNSVSSLDVDVAQLQEDVALLQEAIENYSDTTEVIAAETGTWSQVSSATDYAYSFTGSPSGAECSLLGSYGYYTYKKWVGGANNGSYVTYETYWECT